jgi:hypothetical protein
MPTIKTAHFGLIVRDSPLINVRIEFIRHLALLRNQEFQQRLSSGARTIQTPYALWGGRPEVLLTQLLRGAIHGVEGYVSAAVHIEAIKTARSSKDLVEATKNPWSLRGSNMADNVFNRLPALLNERFALKVAHKHVWKKINRFYADVRNPLFHGYELSSPDWKPVLEAYEFLWTLYQWIDEWHNVGDLPGGHGLTELPDTQPRANASIPDPAPSVMPRSRIKQVKGWALLGRNLVLLNTMMDDGTQMPLELTHKSGATVLGVLPAAAMMLNWPLDSVEIPGIRT